MSIKHGDHMAGFTFSARLKSFVYAFSGLGFMLRTQHNAWLHSIASLIVVAVGIGLRVSLADWRWLVIAMAMVWVAEIFNTAVEYICDVVSPDYSIAVKHAKDIAAGAVLVCAMAAAFIGAFTLWPYLHL